MDILLVGLGGGLGAISRYILSSYIGSKQKTKLPFNTFTVNIAGCFMLGFFTYTLKDHRAISLVEVGFMGGFTTFSTFMLENFTLIKEHSYLETVLYVLFSIIIGALFFVAGMYLAFLF